MEKSWWFDIQAKCSIGTDFWDQSNWLNEQRTESIPPEITHVTHVTTVTQESAISSAGDDSNLEPTEISEVPNHGHTSQNIHQLNHTTTTISTVAFHISENNTVVDITQNIH